MGSGSWVGGENYEIFNLVEQNETGQGPASSSWKRMLKIGEESGKSEWQDSLSAATSHSPDIPSQTKASIFGG